MVREAMAVAMALVAGGCAELVQGPRVVHHENDRFYVRHALLADSRRDADALAVDECLERSGEAVLTRVIQYYPLDIRVAEYTCRTAAVQPAGEPGDG